MFIMYFPQMIEAGMVYKAVPPLYSINNGKDKVKDSRTGKMVSRDRKVYFTEQIDIVRYIQKIFLKSNKITDLKKNPISNKDITLLFLRNTDYIYHLEENLSRMYAVDPELMELVLIHYVTNKNSINLPKLKKEISSKYRFMDAYKEKGTIVIKGTIEKSNLIIFNDKFLSDAKVILDIMYENKSLYYMVNGKKMSIYQIMKIYQDTAPNGVQRYKGLGEMQDWELAESTLYPGSNRTLIRYTLEDAMEEINAIREFESTPKKILGYTGSITREDLLE